MPHAHPTSVGSYTAEDRNTYTYDRDSSNGNTTQDDLGHTLVYDAWNRLTQVKDAAVTLKSYSYDAFGRRTTETTPLANPTELYYSAGWQVIEEDTGASGVTLQSQTVYSPVYSDAIVLRDYDFNSNGATSFSITERVYATQDANFNVTGLVTFHTLDGDADGDGTISTGELGLLATNYGLTKPGGDAAGDFSHDGKIDVTDLGILSTNYGTNSTNSGLAVAERIAYNPYGTFDVRKGSDWTAQSNEYLGWVNFHQGLRLDRDTGIRHSVSNAWVIGTGWYDSRGRVYSATLGRFGQAEPSGGKYIDGMNLNWAYGGNPINGLDPFGLQATRPVKFDDSNTTLFGKLSWTVTRVPRLLKQPGQQARLDLTFTPNNRLCTSADISFIQVVTSHTFNKKSITGPHPIPLPKNQEEFDPWTDFKPGAAGFTPMTTNSYLDHGADDRDPFYGAKQNKIRENEFEWINEDDGFAVGHANDNVPAIMYDMPGDTVAGTHVVDFEVFAIDVKTGRCYGGISWGYTCVMPGSIITLHPVKSLSMPSLAWNEAALRWNEFATKMNKAYGREEYVSIPKIVGLLDP